MKIAVVTCYHDPDYVRARSLRAAVAAQPGVKSIVIKNKSKGFLRYPQVLWRMLVVKWRQKPAAFLITFRGQEILPLVLLIAGRTPVWFDEFIVPSAYARAEKHKKSFTILVKHFQMVERKLARNRTDDRAVRKSCNEEKRRVQHDWNRWCEDRFEVHYVSRTRRKS
jgi:hypothetical protein